MSPDRRDEKIRIAFCGGGSGGHLTPSIAIVQLLHPQAEFLFCVSSRPIDDQILQGGSLPDSTVILTQPLLSSGSRWRYLRDVCRSVPLCLKQFRRFRPNVVVGTGGFASAPGLIAARILKLPILLFEANAVSGRANRWFAAVSQTTFTGLPWTEDQVKGWKSHVEHTGVPLRKLPTRTTRRRQIFITGGSQGSDRLNTIVAEALVLIRKSIIADNWEVLHQTGPRQVDSLTARYESAGIRYRLTEFVDDPILEMQRSAIVITRAGAVALAEVEASGSEAICVPLSSSADGHQLANAQAFAAKTGAAMVDETAADAVQNLSEAISQLLSAAIDRPTETTTGQTTTGQTAAERVAQRIMEFAPINAECVDP